MPLFESKKLKNVRLFKEALPWVFSAINQNVPDTATQNLYSAWAAGANLLAETLATESEFVGNLWGEGSKEKAFVLSKILIPVMMSRYFWKNSDEFRTREARNLEFENHLPLVLKIIFVSLTEKNELFQDYFVNLNRQFIFECDWLQGKAIASESDGSGLIWDIFQYAGEYELNQEQRTAISEYFDTQYSLLADLGGQPLSQHVGTPTFFEFMLWNGVCSQIFTGEQFINWEAQIPIEGSKQLFTAMGSPLNELSIGDFASWVGGIAGGQMAMAAYLPSADR